jgi:magnesium-transporting ATPase (P-type)
LVLLVNIVLHRPLLESFLFSVALAVGMTPEMMPMIVTITLAEGARRMAKVSWSNNCRRSKTSASRPARELMS